MPREITTDGVIVIDHEELRGADVVSLFSERDTYANWKRQADKRIADLEAVAREVIAVYRDPEGRYEDNDIPAHLYKMACDAVDEPR